MSINYAILGLLSQKPCTGYELKKRIQDSPFMPWSGNNNQIYKVLLDLYDNGLVTSEELHQDASPTKKMYTITSEGISELREWLLSEPEIPDIKNMFLIKLLYEKHLSEKETDELFLRYDSAVKLHLLLLKEQAKRDAAAGDNNDRGKVVSQAVYDNMIMTYECELEWIRKTREK